LITPCRKDEEYPSHIGLATALLDVIA